MEYTLEERIALDKFSQSAKKHAYETLYAQFKAGEILVFECAPRETELFGTVRVNDGDLHNIVWQGVYGLSAWRGFYVDTVCTDLCTPDGNGGFTCGADRHIEPDWL